MYLTLAVFFLRTFRKIRSSGRICKVARQRPRFYLRGPIRRGDGAYLTCKMREHMLTLNLCKKDGNDQESLCKDFTEIANEKKNLAKAHFQNFKGKKSFLYEQFLIVWKIILSQ